MTQHLLAFVQTPEGLAGVGTAGAVISFALHQLWRMNATLSEIASLMRQRGFCPIQDMAAKQDPKP